MPQSKWDQFVDWWNSLFAESKSSTFQPHGRILCIDLDADFSKAVLRAGMSIGIEAIIANSIEIAKKKIEGELPYNAFVIGGLLSDGSGFELAAWIRESRRLETPIAFVSGIYHDAASFRILKEQLKVDYVLDKPLKPENILLLLQELRLGRHLRHGDYYQQTIVDKIERLEKIIDQVQEKPTLENLQHLRGFIHKIAGSSGSFGYPKVSEMCKHLEMELTEQIELATELKSNSKWLASLDKFFNDFKFNFQFSVDQEPYENMIGSDLQELSKVKILLVDDDEDSVYFITGSLSELGIELKTLKDSLLIQETLMNYQPDMILADLDLADQKKLDLLHFLKDNSDNIKLVGMVTVEEEVHLIHKIYKDVFVEILVKPIVKQVLQKKVIGLFSLM